MYSILPDKMPGNTLPAMTCGKHNLSCCPIWRRGAWRLYVDAQASCTGDDDRHPQRLQM